MVIVLPNNAINPDGLGQRAFGASPNPAGCDERWTETTHPCDLRQVHEEHCKIRQNLFG